MTRLRSTMRHGLQLLGFATLGIAGPTAGFAGTGEPVWVESSGGLVPPTLEGGRTEVEMGDVNGDGLLDLVSIGDHGSPFINSDQHGVMVWFGDGSGSWSVHMEGDFGYGGVALGDVNGDGLLDVGYGMHHAYSGTDFGDQLLEVALGDGSGESWTPWDDGLASSGEEWGMFGTDFADVDHDGDLDIGSVSFGCCAGVHVYLNQGDGTWVQSFGLLGGNSQMLFAFGEIDGDGHPDFAVSHEAGTVYLGDGAGGFVPADGDLPPPGATGLGGLALGDADGDGRDDLAFVGDSGSLQVWRLDGPGQWQNLSGDLPTSGPWQAVQLLDMDRDGRVDLLAFGGGQGAVWAGDGTGGWSQIASLATPPPGDFRALRAGGDADHNGFPDFVLVANEGVWPNDRNEMRFFREASIPQELGIEPVRPRGGETFRAGGAVFLDWISAVPTGGPGVVSVELSIDGPGGPWTLLAGSLVNGGRVQWTIPAATPETSSAHLRYTLTVGAQSVTAVTPAPFTILRPVGELIFADGFESGDTSAWSVTVP